MKFNRADDVSLFTCLRRYLGTCLVNGHVWSDWWWRRYLTVQYRICQRCGLEEEMFIS
jgi:hypothetical protein